MPKILYMFLDIYCQLDLGKYDMPIQGFLIICATKGDQGVSKNRIQQNIHISCKDDPHGIADLWL